MDKNCLMCGELLIYPRRKFCGASCSLNWYYKNNERYREHRKEYAKKYAVLHKNDPEYKRKRREWFRNWLDRNREHFNKTMRENRYKRLERIKNGRTEKVKLL